MTTSAPAPLRPGRPRNQATGDAILAAALELLGERGYGALTVCSVIERAGVSSATLYHRWPTKQQLIVAAVASLVPEPTTTDTGSLGGDLRALLDQIAGSIAARREDIADALASEVKRDADLALALHEKFQVPRLTQLDQILDRAIRRGELSDRPSAESALSLIVGPVYHRAFVLGEPLTAEFLEAAAAHAGRGLGAAALGRRRSS